MNGSCAKGDLCLKRKRICVPKCLLSNQICRILILIFVDGILLSVWWVLERMIHCSLYHLESSSQGKVKLQLAASLFCFLKDGRSLLAGKDGSGNGFEISTQILAYIWMGSCKICMKYYSIFLHQHLFLQLVEEEIPSSVAIKNIAFTELDKLLVEDNLR